MNLIGGILFLGIALMAFCALFGILLTCMAISIRMVTAAVVAVAAVFQLVADEPHMDNRCPDCGGVEGCTPHCPGSAAHHAASPPGSAERPGQGFKALSQFDRKR